MTNEWPAQVSARTLRNKIGEYRNQSERIKAGLEKEPVNYEEPDKAHHSHFCPDCGRRTSGVGESVCPPCQSLRFAKVSEHSKQRLRTQGKRNEVTA